MVASLFASIDNTATLPWEWSLVIILSIYKTKGRLLLTIDLLAHLILISKMYATHLKEKLLD